MTANSDLTTTQTLDLKTRRRLFSLMIMRVIAAIFFLAGTGIFFSIPENPDWKYYLLALGLNLIGALIMYLTSDAVTHHDSVLTRFQILFDIGLFAIGVFVMGTSLPVAFIILLFSIMLSSSSIQESDNQVGISIGIVSAFLVLASGIFMQRVQITLPFIEAFLPPLVGMLVMSYIVMINSNAITVPLRIKLIVASLVMVIVPLVVLSLVSTTSIHSSVSAQRNETLSLAAERTAQAVDEFFSTNQNSVEEDSKNPLLVRFLSEPENQRNPLLGDLKITFAALNQRSSEFVRSYGLLDKTGNNIFDTDDTYLNQVEGFSDYFIEAFALQKTFVSEVRFAEDRKPYFFISSPVKDETGNPIGVLRMVIKADAIQYVLFKYLDLAGPGTRPLLIDENQIRLADAYNSTFLFKTLAPLSQSQITSLKATGRLPNQPDALLSTNMMELSQQLFTQPEKKIYSAMMTTSFPETKNQETITYAEMKSKPWRVLYTQRTDVLQNLVASQTTLSWLITTIIAFFTTIFATILARTISNPVLRLTGTAQEIVSGNLNAVAEVTTSDEVGTLASMFNAMTSQLRAFISELEDRVAARTRELDEQNKSLANRSQQIQTIADVARSISSTQDLEKLLNLVTELVCERFDFYHAGIFLLDEKKQYAVLRAANSVGGKRMLARQHKLQVGQVGIVGYVTAKGEARIATDVGEDAVYFNNPDLPQTRSEMALPLMASGEVIGALDIQSTKSNAFSKQDTELFATLADQVVVGIINSRLFDDTQKALEEAQAVHRQYLKQEWVSQVNQQTTTGYQYVAGNILPLNPSSQTLEASEFQAASPETATMHVPILLKGQAIGAIKLQDMKEGGREWNETEIKAAQTVADQIAQALENARLFEQTARRAERERKALEITGKIRSTNDPQAMLEIAIAEVKKALGASRVQVVFNSAQPTSEDGNGFHADNTD